MRLAWLDFEKGSFRELILRRLVVNVLASCVSCISSLFLSRAGSQAEVAAHKNTTLGAAPLRPERRERKPRPPLARQLRNKVRGSDAQCPGSLRHWRREAASPLFCNAEPVCTWGSRIDNTHTDLSLRSEPASRPSSSRFYGFELDAASFSTPCMWNLRRSQFDGSMVLEQPLQACARALGRHSRRTTRRHITRGAR